MVARKYDCPECHGALSHDGRRPFGESTCPTTVERARILARSPAARARAAAAYRSGRAAERAADQLERGEQIPSRANHHRGMAALLERLGSPRPEGMTLSLIAPEGPDAYWGRQGGKPYRLSTNPADYTWESLSDNVRRGRPTLEPFHPELSIDLSTGSTT